MTLSSAPPTSPPFTSPSALHTPSAYLETEEQATQRSEYWNGILKPMAGGSANHNRIAGEFYKQFPSTLAGQTYEIFMGDMKLWIPATRSYLYPDILVIQGEIIYHQERRDVVENPCLIVEVLSKSTQQYDQADKFDAYRSIPSLREYVMVDQYSFWVKQFGKNDRGQWVLTELLGQDATLCLESLPFQISLTTLYQRAQFETG